MTNSSSTTQPANTNTTLPYPPHNESDSSVSKKINPNDSSLNETVSQNDAPGRPRGGVLFCGGCNPRYDRLSFYQQLLEFYKDGESAAENQNQKADHSRRNKGNIPAVADKHVSVDLALFDPEQQWDFIAIVNGCLSECLPDKAEGFPTVLLSSGLIEDAVRKINRLFVST